MGSKDVMQQKDSRIQANEVGQWEGGRETGPTAELAGAHAVMRTWGGSSSTCSAREMLKIKSSC